MLCFAEDKPVKQNHTCGVDIIRNLLRHIINPVGIAYHHASGVYIIRNLLRYIINPAGIAYHHTFGVNICYSSVEHDE